MYLPFVRNNITLVSITIFIIIFAVVQYIQPMFLYNTDKSIREFGVGYRNKTIMPVWLFSIFLGILSYIMVLGFITYF